MPLSDAEFQELLKQHPPDKQTILRRWRINDLRGAAEIRRRGAHLDFMAKVALAILRSRT